MEIRIIKSTGLYNIYKREIYFVLSNADKIVLDALEGQFYSDVKGLRKFYREITKQQQRSKIVLQTQDEQ